MTWVIECTHSMILAIESTHSSAIECTHSINYPLNVHIQ